jgi:LytR cell envelope-related transcriptional attenuator/Tetratricopeptide repeat
MIGKLGLRLGAMASMLVIAGCSVEAPPTGTAVGAAQGSQEWTGYAAFEKGKVNLSAGHLGLALEEFKRALAQDPRSAPVLNALAVTYDRLGRHDIAELYFDRALAIEPGYSVALNNVGFSMLKRGRYEEALIYFDQALKSEPLAPAKRLIKANMQAAMDKLRLARQRGDTPAVTKASLDNGVVRENDDCRMQSRHAIGRVGERVFKLVTNPVGTPRIEGLSDASQRCANADRPRVAMVNTGEATKAVAHVHQLTTVVQEKPVVATVANNAKGPEQSPVATKTGGTKEAAAVAVADSVKGPEQSPVATKTGGTKEAATALVADSGKGPEQSPVATKTGGTKEAVAVAVADSAKGPEQSPVAATTGGTKGAVAVAFADSGKGPEQSPVATKTGGTKEAPPQARPVAPAEALTVEVSNGAGRNQLAARVRGYLESKGLNVSYLTNAASFDNARTAVFYKKGQRQAAERFAKQLPIAADLIESNENYADIRIRLGADILDFDKNVLYAVAMGERNV